VENIRHQ